MSTFEEYGAFKEPGHRIYNNIVCAPSEDSGQPLHPHRLIRVFVVHFAGSKGSRSSSGGRTG